MAIVYRLPIDDATADRLLAPAAAAIGCDVRFLRKYLAVCWELHKRGVAFKVGELKPRSAAYQAKLYAQGRTTPGPIVTHAKPGTSYHERGKAGHIEVAFKDRFTMGEIAENAGLVWGGRWTTKFPPHGDYLHIEDHEP
jgi:peptidoglycan LD-endopeptidase CwlK